MTQIEYRVVPAPRRSERVKGVKTPEDRFARALSAVLNAQAADGWEYLRTDTLPSEEREGLMGGRTTVYHNMLIFRRGAAPVAAAPVPQIEDRRAEPVAVPAAPAAPTAPVWQPPSPGGSAYPFTTPAIGGATRGAAPATVTAPATPAGPMLGDTSAGAGIGTGAGATGDVPAVDRA